MSAKYEKNIYLALLAEQCNRFEEMVELLESIKDKDGFVYFLIGRSYMVGRGVEIDLENAIQYLNIAYENGIDIAKLYVCDLENDWDKKAKYSKDLIE